MGRESNRADVRRQASDIRGAGRGGRTGGHADQRTRERARGAGSAGARPDSAGEASSRRASLGRPRDAAPGPAVPPRRRALGAPQSCASSVFLGGFETPQVRAQIGEKFPVIYGSSYARDANGHLLIGSDGLPMAGEMKVIGRVSPDFLLGFSNTLTVFGTTLNAVFSWKKGGQMYGGTNGLLGYYGRSKATENRDNKIVDGYHEDGTKNTTAVSLQSYYNTINNIDEASIYNNSFLKLREISLSRDIVNKPYMKLAATVFARNILIWSNYPNFDPESTQGNTNMAGGFERFSLPQTTNYGLGLNFKF